ncbi:MAG: amidohydrolase family protein [Nitrospiraceae bacterium]|nr:amidohydrolase family protein [Nitrospiraceae bacterium]
MFQGLIDLHTHGIGKYDTKTVCSEDILKMAELHANKCASAILPTIYPGPISLMRKQMEAVKKAMDIQASKLKVRSYEIQNSKISSSLILGVHLEGPFLNPLRAGALDKKHFIKPSTSALKKLIDGYEDMIKIATLAPEIPGALKLIEKFNDLNIRVNMGHSDATYEQAFEGKQAGATGITHIFNAMKPFHHREPGLSGFGLIDEDIYIEVIADGIHLHPKTLELIFSKKRLDKIIIVSDSIKKTSAVKKSIQDKKTILKGSSLTISEAIKILKAIGIPDAEIISAAFDNPKRYLLL